MVYCTYFSIHGRGIHAATRLQHHRYSCQSFIATGVNNLIYFLCKKRQLSVQLTVQLEHYINSIMEKEPQPESLATVTIKPDYPPSEVYSSEPPPVSSASYIMPFTWNTHNMHQEISTIRQKHNSIRWFLQNSKVCLYRNFCCAFVIKRYFRAALTRYYGQLVDKQISLLAYSNQFFLHRAIVKSVIFIT